MMELLKKIAANKQVISILGVVLSLFSYFYILFNRTNLILRLFSMRISAGFTLAALYTLVLIPISFHMKKKNKLFYFLPLFLVLCLFASHLAGIWASGRTTYNLISGLLPYTDALTYYTDSLRIVNGIIRVSSFRGFFTAFFASLLLIFNGNLLYANALITLLIAVACWLMAEQIEKSFSGLSAGALTFFVFFFAREFMGKVMSENLGLVIGLLGFTIVWRGVRKGRLMDYYIGLICLTLAMIIRPGPVGVLLMLLIWGGFFFVKSGKMITYHIIVGVFFIVICLAFNSLIQIIFHAPSANSFSNYLESFYGLAQGGMGWAKVYLDYPTLRSVPSSELAGRILVLSLQHIHQNPTDLLKGIINQYTLLFDFPGTQRHLFSFITYPNLTLNSIILAILYVLLVGGLILAFNNRKRFECSFVLMTFFGLLLSVPLLPTSDFMFVRPYASAIPFIGFPFLIVICEMTRKQAALYTTSFREHVIEWTWVFAGLLMIFPFLSLISHQIPTNRLEDETCFQGQDMALVRFYPGSFINVLPTEKMFVDWMPNFHENVYKHNLGALPVNTAKVSYRKPKAPFRLITTLDLLHDDSIVVVLEDTESKLESDLSVLCGNWDSQPEIIGYGKFFFVD